MHAVISDMVIPIKLAIYLYGELYTVIHHAVSALAITSYIHAFAKLLINFKNLSNGNDPLTCTQMHSILKIS